MRVVGLACFLFLSAACQDSAPQRSPPVSSASLSVEDAWVTPTPGGVDVSAGYLTITNNTSSDDTLVAAHSPRAGRVEVHEMIADGAVMRMRQAPGLIIPAGESLSLAPGGAHLMFFDIAQPFAPGEDVLVTLVFEQAGEVPFSFPVRQRASGHGDH